MHRLKRRPPAAVEAEYYSKQTNDQIVVHTQRSVHETRGGSGAAHNKGLGNNPTGKNSEGRVIPRPCLEGITG